MSPPVFPAGIVGHRDQVGSLVQDLASNNVVHAYLFSGPPHLGKFTIAKWFAKQLLMEGKEGIEGGRLAGEVDKLLHPDLFIIDQLWIEDVCEDFDVIAKSSNVPQQHRSKAKAKTDTISIEDIRVLHERLHEVSTGTFRCCLIRRVERMQVEAVNALLKVLEEPPPGVVFLLSTESLGQLLPTLVSRTRVLRFQRLPNRELQSLISGVSEDDVQFLLRIAQGAPGTLCRLRDDPDVLRQERKIFSDAVTFWRTGSLSERLRLLTPLSGRTAEAEHFLLHLALALREFPEVAVNASPSFHVYLRGLETNAQRQLLAQQFALAITE